MGEKKKKRSRISKSAAKESLKKPDRKMRVSKKATETLSEKTEIYMDEVGKTASALTKHRGKKTIQEQDVHLGTRLTLKQRYQSKKIEYQESKKSKAQKKTQKEKWKDQSEKHKKKAADTDAKLKELREKQDRIADRLTPEPVKVGHHSEGGHRKLASQMQNLSEKISNLEDKKQEHLKKSRNLKAMSQAQKGKTKERTDRHRDNLINSIEIGDQIPNPYFGRGNGDLVVVKKNKKSIIVKYPDGSQSKEDPLLLDLQKPKIGNIRISEKDYISAERERIKKDKESVQAAVVHLQRLNKATIEADKFSKSRLFVNNQTEEDKKMFEELAKHHISNSDPDSLIALVNRHKISAEIEKNKVKQDLEMKKNMELVDAAKKRADNLEKKINQKNRGLVKS